MAGATWQMHAIDAPGGTADVVIVGGGVIGCATAYYLAEQGVRVALIEQQRIGGPPSASGASAAILEALAGSPPPLAQQAQLARRLLAELAPQLRDLTGIDIELQQLGSFHLAFSEQEALALRQQLAPRFAALGEPAHWCEAAEVRRLEPALAETVRGALAVPRTQGLYAPRYVRALAAGAAARGALIREGVPATGFEVRGARVLAVRTTEGTFSAGQVVLATGAWTGMVSRWLGTPLAIGPERGQIMALAPAPGQPRVAHVLFGGAGYVIPKANGTACVGATHERAGFDARVTLYGLRFLSGLAQQLVPGLEGAALKHLWMGFRPLRLDGGLPALGRLPGFDNAFVAAGHGAIGVTVSAAAGYLMAHLLQGRPTELPLEAFDPAGARPEAAR